jgi:hypothetical protein
VKSTTPLDIQERDPVHWSHRDQPVDGLPPTALSRFHPDSQAGAVGFGVLAQADSACLRTWPFSLCGYNS